MIVVSSTIRAGRLPVVTVRRASTWQSGRSSASVRSATTEPRANTSTAALRRPATTAAPAPTRPQPEAFGAHAQPDMSVRRATSSSRAVPKVRAPSVFAMAARAVRHPARVAPNSTSAPVGRDSTAVTAPSSIPARRRPVSTAPPAPACPGSSTRARARKDTPGGYASGGHLAKVVRVGTGPLAWVPVATPSAASARPDIPAAPATKATSVSWQMVRSV